MNWSRIATDRMQPEDCMVFSDWLEEHGDERRAVGLRRMARDGKWPLTRRTIDHQTKSRRLRVLTYWIREDIDFYRRHGVPWPGHCVASEHLWRSRMFISVGSKTFWRRDGIIFNRADWFEADDPVAEALRFGAHLFGGLPE